MFATYGTPPVDDWEDDKKPRLIEFVIMDICRNIYTKGPKNHFPEAFDCLYEYIEDNLEKYLPSQH
jgi:hypothetical protein